MPPWVPWASGFGSKEHSLLGLGKAWCLGLLDLAPRSIPYWAWTLIGLGHPRLACSKEPSLHCTWASWLQGAFLIGLGHPQAALGLGILAWPRHIHLLQGLCILSQPTATHTKLPYKNFPNIKTSLMCPTLSECM